MDDTPNAQDIIAGTIEINTTTTTSYTFVEDWTCGNHQLMRFPEVKAEIAIHFLQRHVSDLIALI